MSDLVGGAHSQSRRRRNLCRRAPTFSLNVSFLPDEVVEEILSRLPAKDVLRYRCVCKKWKDLPSTQDFIDLHIRHSFPMILKDNYPLRLKDYKGPSLLDGCWIPTRLNAKIQKLNHPGAVLFSHNGLIVARGEGGIDVVIYNPLYIDAVNITFRGEVYGVFFHPVQQEYCTLWQIFQSLGPLKFQLTVLNLESNPNLRDIKNPCPQNDRISDIRPVLIDRYLYWMVKSCQDNTSFSKHGVNCDVVEYDIGKEEFRLIPCHIPISLERHAYGVNLLDTDGVVSVVQVVPSKGLVSINIWTLKNDRGQLWTSYNYFINCGVYKIYEFADLPKAVAIRDGQLVLVSDGKIYVCNLKLATLRNFGQNCSRKVWFLSHVMSLVSLKNCKSNICMKEKDEHKP